MISSGRTALDYRVKKISGTLGGRWIFHVRLMIMDACGGYYATLMRYTAGTAHRYSVRLAQPVGFHALLCSHSVIAIEYAVSVQQRCRRQHRYVAT